MNRGITIPIQQRDQQLVQIVDAALADAARRSGNFLSCKPGCMQCCVGVFPITQLDALRLRSALSELEKNDPAKAGHIRSRVQKSVSRLTPDFPGDATTGLLEESEDAAARFEDFANDEPCPVLDPTTGTCDLYAARPLPCRTFGPPVRNEEGGLAVCKLCFHEATPEAVAACEMIPDPDHLEDELLHELQTSTGAEGYTLIAFALMR
ncbi:MAG: YkgJ family cysteine cluster protein [Acidobacteriaceae bacterium]